MAQHQSLNQLCSAVQEMMAKEQDAIESARAAIEADREKLEAEKAAMTKGGAGASDILHLNVGGQIFTVQRSTLLMAPEDSLLSAMFSGRWEESVARDENGRVYLDITPAVFSVILSHLRALRLDPAAKRSRKLPINEEYKAELEAVCKYYAIVGQRLPVSLQMKSDKLQISDEEEGGVVINRGAQEGYASAVGVDLLEVGSVWKVSFATGGWHYAGIIANLQPSYGSHSDPSSFGWSSSNQVYKAGQVTTGEGGWSDHWSAGDVAIFALRETQLRMCCLREPGRIYSLSLPPRQDWRLHINLFFGGTRATLTSATTVESRLLGA